MTPAFEVHDLTVAYDGRPVLWDVDVEIPAGVLAAIVGPNGAGKSTLLKAALDLVHRTTGTARFFGQDLHTSRRRLAYVPQRTAVDWEFPIDVLGVVLMGTYGRLGWLRRPGRAERTVAMEALDRVGMADLAQRHINALSGGQKQRVFVARALAQGADLFLLDEPFAGVDIVTEEAIFRTLRELRDAGKSVVVVHHDLDTVRAAFDHVTLLNVEIVASGPASVALEERNLRAAYTAHAGA